MKHAIEILNIELYKWKAFYNEHEFLFIQDPNMNNDKGMGVAKPKIKQLEKAIKVLEKTEMKL